MKEACKIAEVCGDYAVVRNDGYEPILPAIFNSRANAEVVKAIMEHEAAHPNEAVPYMQAASLPVHWISVDDRLPKAGQDVLMLFDTGNMAVGWLHDADEHRTFWCACIDDGFYMGCDCMPTHWMPLPAMPSEKREDND